MLEMDARKNRTSTRICVFLAGCYEHEMHTLSTSFDVIDGFQVEFVPTTCEQLLERDFAAGEKSILLMRFQTPLHQLDSLASFYELECLLALRLKCPMLPWIGVANEPDPTFDFLSQQLGAVGFWHPLMGFSELAQQITAFFRDTTPHGPLEPGLFDKLIFAHLLKQSAAFRVEMRGHVGFVIMVSGAVHYARTTSASGMRALLEMLMWGDLTLQVQKPMIMLRENVQLPFLELLQELSRAWQHWEAAEVTDGPVSALMQLCDGMLSEVNGAQRCGLVDLDSGMLLAADVGFRELGLDAHNAIASSLVSMFRGQPSHQIQDALLPGRKAPNTASGDDLMQEIFIKAPEMFLFMKLLPESRLVSLLVTKKSSNRALSWMAMQSFSDAVGQLVDLIE